MSDFTEFHEIVRHLRVDADYRTLDDFLLDLEQRLVTPGNRKRQLSYLRKELLDAKKGMDEAINKIGDALRETGPSGQETAEM